MENKIFTARRGRLSSDLSEEGGKAVVVVLTPAFKRMVMTLRTLHAHTEEQLSHIFQLLFRLLHTFVPRYRRIGDHRAGRRQEFADQLII